jgi:hypothetical protein
MATESMMIDSLMKTINLAVGAILSLDRNVSTLSVSVTVLKLIPSNRLGSVTCLLRLASWKPSSRAGPEPPVIAGPSH